MGKPSAVTALRKLELSQLDPRTVQQELLGDDLDLEKLVVYLKGQIKFDAAEAVLDVRVTRTIEGASTVVVSLNDYDRTILNSGLLNARLDIQINGLWFRLVKVERSPGASQLDLTFEDREIAVLRSYPKKGTRHKGIKFAHRSKVTRAEFILNLVREVKEFKIPVVIPELHQVQPIEVAADDPNFGKAASALASSNMSPGVNEKLNSAPTEGHINPRLNIPGVASRLSLTAKGVAATKEQIKNANIILNVGVSMGARRKVLKAGIAVPIVESVLRNLAGGDQDSVGLYQQRASWGSYRDRHDPATAAKLFFEAAIKQDEIEPNAAFWVLCADVQRPREDLRTLYGNWQIEADRWVTAFGIPGSDNAGTAASVNNSGEFVPNGSDYIYYRGTPKEGGKVWEREDSWACIQRLAGEVNWRAFFISGVFYLLPEDDLLKTQPIMIIDETSPGVEGIGFDYDIGKKFAIVSLPLRVGTWLAPPGAVVSLQHVGPVSGRWIVSEFDRSLFDSAADVTLKKPLPLLPEPFKGENITVPSWAQGSGNDPAASPDIHGNAASLAGQLVARQGKGWTDDNGMGKSQLFKVSIGQKLNGADGAVPLDPRPIKTILWLIGEGFKIGTFSWCEDHSDDGLKGHSGGLAVDISSINGVSINTDTPECRKNVLHVLEALAGPAANAAGVTPRQMISGGYGGHRDLGLSELSIPAADSYYGATTMQQHTNHIHVGF